MAILPVGAGGGADFWKYETALTAGGSNPWTAVPRSSGPAVTLAAGDLIWAQTAWNAEEAPAMAVPSGWTVPAGFPFVQGGALGLVLAYRVVVDPAGEPAAYQWQPKALDGTTSLPARGSVGIRVYRGVDPDSPLDVAPSRGNDSTPVTGGVTFNAPSLATATPGAFLITGVGLDFTLGDDTITAPAGLSKVYDLLGRRQACAEPGAQALPGPSGPRAWATSASSVSYVTYQAALREGAPGWKHQHAVIIG